jgi:serine/threonine-protein kinase
VVRVEDVGEEKGYAYMILELLEGEDLAHVLERHRPLPVLEVVTYMLEALEGVKLAHDKGIIHRDLKPSNLFLAKNDNGTTIVKVLDFGISKSSSLAAVPSALTTTKAMLGAPMYMSPEHLRSPRSVDARADIWALGVIMYELLTGTLPFMGETLGELFSAILELVPVPVREYRPEVPAELEAIVMRCLQSNPDHRFQTVSEIIAALTPLSIEIARNGVNGIGLAPMAVTHQLPGPGAKILGPTPPPSFGMLPLPDRTVGLNPVDASNGSTVVATTMPIGSGNTPQPHLKQSGFNVLEPAHRQHIWSQSKARTLFAMVAGGLAIVGLVLIAVAWSSDPPKPSKTHNDALHDTSPPLPGSSLATQAPAPHATHDPVVAQPAAPAPRDAPVDSVVPVVEHPITAPSEHSSTVATSGLTTTDAVPTVTTPKQPGPGTTRTTTTVRQPGPGTTRTTTTVKQPGPGTTRTTTTVATPPPTNTASGPGYSNTR